VHELRADAFGSVRPLLDGLEHNLVMAAAVERTCPARIWADDADAPRLALMSTPEGHFLAGAPPGEERAASLQDLVLGEILPRGEERGWDVFCLHYPDARWERPIGRILEGHTARWDYQRYFVLRDLKLDWRDGLPAGFSMRQVDDELLGGSDPRNIAHVRDWAESNFGSRPVFSANGFGFCLVHGDEIVSWCMADCVVGSRCEVGIHTDAGHRRRGFAKCTAAAAAEYCLASGLTHIGWHCWSANIGSAATAMAVGFEEVLQHPGVNVSLGR
jgi:RimJ/RimL family protein N-acetyltransferase